MKNEPEGPMEGRLPIKVLVEGMLVRFGNIAEGFVEETQDEIKYRGFRPEVICSTARDRIKEPCVLKEHRVRGTDTIVRAIEIEESFLQFLWCIAYAVNVMHHELIVQPLLMGLPPKLACKDDPRIQQALRVSQAGSQLLDTLDIQVFCDLPNPERPTTADMGFVGAANQIFLAAGAFVLLHEVGHQFLGHSPSVSDDSAKEEEFQADLYAVDWVKRGLGQNPVDNVVLCAGIMVAMIALLLLHSDLDGGPAHPHPDERALRVLEHLGLSDNDPMWSLGLCGLPMWIATHGEVDLGHGQGERSSKGLFTSALRQLVMSRRPPICP